MVLNYSRLYILEKVNIEKKKQQMTKEHDEKLPRPNKKICLFWVTGLKILARVGTHIFFNYFFFWEKYNFMHF